jgi:histidinol-phosphate aminotransferase
MNLPELAQLAPGHIRGISRYIAGKPTDELARELGLDPTTIVKLASNENPRGPGPSVRAAIAEAVAELPRYPDSNGFALKAALSRRLSVAPEQLVLGNGSNDVLELVTLAFLQPGDEAIYAQHAFIVYPLATQARGARGIVVPAKAFGHDLSAMRAAITPKTRVLFIANPNNPTGTWIPHAELEAFIAAVPRDVVVVLDEAYNEYLVPTDRAPSVEWIARYRNLVVSRTFSKAYGLAALRVGYGVMDAAIADLLNRVRQPFNVNTLAQAAALAALADADYVEESRLLNEAGLAQLAAGLQVLGVRYVPSHANFVLANVGAASDVNTALLKQGVIVRPVANYGLPEWLRITVGLPEENTRFLTALTKALKG